VKRLPPIVALVALLLTTACTTVRPVAPSVERVAPLVEPVAPPVETAPSSFSLFPQLKEDGRRIFRAPLDWNRSDWLKVGIAAAAVGGALWLDEDLREMVVGNTNGTKSALAKASAPFGAEYSLATLGAFYLAGGILKDERAKAVAEDGLAASLFASGIITPILKGTIGRRRPSQTPETVDLGDGGASFPSGHTTQAFAVASVIAAHYDSLWIRGAAYAIAGLVGLSRMQENAHYASDVLAGALIGAAVGNAVVRIHDERRFRISAAPSVDPHSRGAALTIGVDLSGLIRFGP
jgi:hypothetical protein